MEALWVDEFTITLKPNITYSMIVMLSQVQTNRCARISDDSHIDLDVCDPQPELYFELTARGQLLATATGLCLTVTKTYYITAEECKKPLEKTQVCCSRYLHVT